MFAYEFEVSYLEENVRRLREELEEQMRLLRGRFDEVDDKVIDIQETRRKESSKELQTRGKVARVDDWMNDLQDQVNALGSSMAQLQGQVERMTRKTGTAEMDIAELKRRIAELSDRVGNVISRVDPEERSDDLEKRITEQDKEIAKLKDENQKILATLGRLITGSFIPGPPPPTESSVGPQTSRH